GLHPDEQVPVVEIVFTRLHAGGKFDKGDEGAYSFSGGLHGVGVSVTNALSKRLDVEVWRDGEQHAIGFAGGDVAQALASRPLARGEPRSGTRVRSWPDPKYFDSPTIPVGDMTTLLRSKAVLLPGLRVALVEEKAGRRTEWHYPDGLRGYLGEPLAHGGAPDPVIPVCEGAEHAPEG